MGARKNEVTLTFAGDADQLEKANNRVKASTAGVEQAFDGVTMAANRMDKSMSGVDASADRLSRIAGRGGADFRSYRSDLDGVGDGFNDVEDRAMGAGNLIGGFSDVMKGGSQGTAQFAMGLSDMAAGMRYTVVPSMQDGVKSVKGALDQMRAGGGVLGAFRRNWALIGTASLGAAAGIGLVTMHLQDQARRQEESRQRVKNYTDQLRELKGDTERLTSTVVVNDERYAHLRGTLADAGVTSEEFAHQLKSGTFDAQQMGDQLGLTKAEVLGLKVQSGELGSEVDKASDALDTNASAAAGSEDAERSLAEAIDATVQAVDDYHDAIQAQFDPAFAWIDATRDAQDAIADETEAQQALNDAINEHGPMSEEAAAAARDLDAAHQGVAESALDQWASEEHLRAALQSGQVTVGEMRARLAQLEQQGYGSGAAAAWLRDQINSIQSRTATIAVYDAASGTIDSVRRNLDNLHGREATTFIRTLVSYRVPAGQTFGGGYAEGGVVYANAGMVAGGPRGTDTVPAWLTPGEMVLNGRHVSNLFRAIDSGAIGGGGGGDTYVVVQGSIRSERELVQLIRDEQTRGGLR